MYQPVCTDPVGRGFFSRQEQTSKRGRPAEIHGSLALELTWTLITLGIVMVMFVWGAKVHFHMNRPPDDATTVSVVGKRWLWKLQQPTGQHEINELHVPVGRAVRLVITSEDSIHSFYVPAFRIKRNAVPGRYSQAWFRATKTGSYQLLCAEYCGIEHSRMDGHIVAMEPQACAGHTQRGGLYLNPVGGGCADPGALRVGTSYVLACTSGNAPAAFPILVSSDLVSWSAAGNVFLTGQRPSWAVLDFWAPEIHQVGGGYVAYFTARCSDGVLAIGAATAAAATGPYADLGHPLVHDASMGMIDATFFADADGVRYLIWKADGNARGQPTPIYGQRLAADGLSLTGSRATLITNDRGWAASLAPARRSARTRRRPDRPSRPTLPGSALATTPSSRPPAATPTFSTTRGRPVT